MLLHAAWLMYQQLYDVMSFILALTFYFCISRVVCKYYFIYRKYVN